MPELTAFPTPSRPQTVSRRKPGADTYNRQRKPAEHAIGRCLHVVSGSKFRHGEVNMSGDRKSPRGLVQSRRKRRRWPCALGMQFLICAGLAARQRGVAGDIPGGSKSHPFERMLCHRPQYPVIRLIVAKNITEQPRKTGRSRGWSPLHAFGGVTGFEGSSVQDIITGVAYALAAALKLLYIFLKLLRAVAGRRPRIALFNDSSCWCAQLRPALSGRAPILSLPP